MKKILITAYFFYPEIAPRAFRAYELAKDLSRLGYDVDIVIPNIEFDYKEVEAEHKLKIFKIQSGFFLNKYIKRSNTKSLQTLREVKNDIIYKIARKFFYCLYMGGKSLEYAICLYKFLSHRDKKYDSVISIGLPISVHIGTSLYIGKNSYLKNHSIADYGDPFSFNKEIDTCFYYKIVEKYFLKNFRYIAVPTENSIEKFCFFKQVDSIKVIPQGFDFSKIKIYKYSKNKIPTFGYAGIFYENIRNPSIFFDFLAQLDRDFRFIIFTDTSSGGNMRMILPYVEKLKGKLDIRHLIPREECIFELSKMDFIVNHNNLHIEQTPSKLIDYMVSMRPIFHFRQDAFNEQEFLKLFDSDYKLSEIDNKRYESDLERFKSNNVTQSFIELLE